MILNDLPWKQTEIVLLFLRLHSSTAFQGVFLIAQIVKNLPVMQETRI